MKKKIKLIAVVIALLFIGVYYYVALPAINIHSSETWFFMFVILLILMVVYMGRKKPSREEAKRDKGIKVFSLSSDNI